MNGGGSERRIGWSVSAFDGRIWPIRSPAKKRSCASAAEWNVRATTPRTPSPASRSRMTPAALSVKVTARISDGSKAPVSTWFAIRRVIVVVLPEPAPARMQTGPRTASTAARCCGFSPSKTSIATQASLGPASAGL